MHQACHLMLAFAYALAGVAYLMLVIGGDEPSGPAQPPYSPSNGANEVRIVSPRPGQLPPHGGKFGPRVEQPGAERPFVSSLRLARRRRATAL